MQHACMENLMWKIAKRKIAKRKIAKRKIAKRKIITKQKNNVNNALCRPLENSHVLRKIETENQDSKAKQKNIVNNAHAAFRKSRNLQSNLRIWKIHARKICLLTFIRKSYMQQNIPYGKSEQC